MNYTTEAILQTDCKPPVCVVKETILKTYKTECATALQHPEMKKQIEILMYRVGTLTAALTEMEKDSNQCRNEAIKKVENEMVELRTAVDMLTAKIINLPVIYQTQFDRLESSSKQENLSMIKEIEQLKENARLDAERIKQLETKETELSRQFTQLKNMVMEHNTKIQQQDETTVRLSNLLKNSLVHRDRPKSANNQVNVVSSKECSQNNIKFRVRSASVGAKKRPFSCSDILEHVPQIHNSTENLHQFIIERKSDKEQSEDNVRHIRRSKSLGKTSDHIQWY